MSSPRVAVKPKKKNRDSLNSDTPIHPNSTPLFLNPAPANTAPPGGENKGVFTLTLDGVEEVVGCGVMTPGVPIHPFDKGEHIPDSMMWASWGVAPPARPRSFQASSSP